MTIRGLWAVPLSSLAEAQVPAPNPVSLYGHIARAMLLMLDPQKKLKSLTVRALANDMAIALMSVTLAPN